MAEAKNEKEWRDPELEAMFDDIITATAIRDAIEIKHGIKIELKVLESHELMTAESIWWADMPTMPRDVIGKARMVNVLAFATTDINGKRPPEPGVGTTTLQDLEHWRRFLIQKYGRFGPALIDKMYNFYEQLCERQAKAVQELVGTEGEPGKLGAF